VSYFSKPLGEGDIQLLTLNSPLPRIPRFHPGIVSRFGSMGRPLSLGLKSGPTDCFGEEETGQDRAEGHSMVLPTRREFC